MEFPIPWRKHRIKTDSLDDLPRSRIRTHIHRFSNEDIEAGIMFCAVDVGVSSSRQLPMQKAFGITKWEGLT
ncbi:hypothetical protein L6452_39887 [Arctium lappa]|uniref:Uncharacterized protein n=1 Tax=Arctium lappa TaxID=4217 RepID=A0ACB8XV78_ARCLA|nr:hypothetical protein L6452_39887 [Arctium lappa]